MSENGNAALSGYVRSDGRKGIRNVLVVAYLVECAHHVAREIASGYVDRDVHLIGFPGCYPNDYALTMMERLCTHPNVGAALLMSLGCEGFNKHELERTIAATGRPVTILGIQNTGGTRKTIAAGRAWVDATLPTLAAQPSVPMQVSELVVGTICGGSDATSGLTATHTRSRPLRSGRTSGCTNPLRASASRAAVPASSSISTTRTPPGRSHADAPSRSRWNRSPSSKRASAGSARTSSGRSAPRSDGT